jgi:hypothetical protein
LPRARVLGPAAALLHPPGFDEPFGLAAARLIYQTSAVDSRKELLVERSVDVAGVTRTISLNEPVVRYADNPILTAHHVNRVWTTPAYRVVAVHNAGVVNVGGKTVMLFRSHRRTEQLQVYSRQPRQRIK